MIQSHNFIIFFATKTESDLFGA